MLLSSCTNFKGFLEFNLFYDFRVAASQLNALGCMELVAGHKQEYVEIAVKLGVDEN